MGTLEFQICQLLYLSPKKVTSTGVESHPFGVLEPNLLPIP